MTVNVALLRKAVEWAEAENEKPSELCAWVQTRYTLPVDSRGPGADGYHFNMEHIRVDRAAYGKSDECGTCYCIAGYVVSLEETDFSYHSVDTRAKQMLGITSEEAEELFAADNKIEDIREIAERIARQKL